VAAGQTARWRARAAVMPGGQKLGRAKLRGIVSEGLILAASELELGTWGPAATGSWCSMT